MFHFTYNDTLTHKPLYFYSSIDTKIATCSGTCVLCTEHIIWHTHTYTHTHAY